MKSNTKEKAVASGHRDVEAGVPGSRLARDRLHGEYTDILGESQEILEVLEKIEVVADTKATVLIQGETGTGKELIAYALHGNSSRSTEALVIVNCAAIPEHLLESELFGHEKGAFTGAMEQHIGQFERAHRSTIFLDEIGEMPLALQPKLLRTLQDKEIQRIGGTKPMPIDFRVVAATNRDLQHAVREGTFREDLYYRLKVVSLSLPPLRERQEDIRLLTEHFLQKHAQDRGPLPIKIASDTLNLLYTYPWPGNIRELENAIFYVCLFGKTDAILPKHLPKDIQDFNGDGWRSAVEVAGLRMQDTIDIPMGLTLKEVEREWILQTLSRLDGNRTRTAQALGMSLSSLYNKLNRYTEEPKL